MKIKVEIPVEIDGPLTANERKRFQAYLHAAAEEELKTFLAQKFGPGARMFKTVCRFAFSEPEVKVE